MAEKSKIQAGSCYDTLVLTHRQVRNFDKARAGRKRSGGCKRAPPNTDSRAFWEGRLYKRLGTDLVHHGREYEKLSICFLYRFTSNKTTWLLFGEIPSSYMCLGAVFF
jgi:hypothetical protein